MAAKEQWKPVVGYEGLYAVSSLGRVKSLDRIVPCKNGTTMTKRGSQILGTQISCRGIST